MDSPLNSGQEGYSHVWGKTCSGLAMEAPEALDEDGDGGEGSKAGRGASCA